MRTEFKRVLCRQGWQRIPVALVITRKWSRRAPLFKRRGSLTTMRLGIGTPIERGVIELVLELSNDVKDFSGLSPECLIVLPKDADVTLKRSQAPLRGIRSFD